MAVLTGTEGAVVAAPLADERAGVDEGATMEVEATALEEEKVT